VEEISPPALSVPAGILVGMQLHRVTIDSEWRPDHAGVRHRRYLVQCLCGWSEGWFPTRTEAAGRYDEHRAAAVTDANMVRAAGARGDHPDPAA
jgi:hypothetical protein